MENSKQIIPAEVKLIEDFVFIDSSGTTSTEYKKIYICRCGRSNNKPFCDGTHKKIKPAN